jgi:hypothetical protein
MKANRNTIDYLGEVLADIASLNKVAKKLKAELYARGAGTYEGTLFQATVSVYDQDTPDETLKAEFAKVVEDYRATLTRQYLTAHTDTKVVSRVLIKSRTGEDIAA